MQYDAVIVGGGAAGLSAALLLARARRRIVLVDDGRHRNGAARAVHGFLTREGSPPAEIYHKAHEELSAYPTVERRNGCVVKAEPGGCGFAVTLSGGESFTARKVVLATGVVDKLPEIPGFTECYGRSVHHCPYCEGYEVRDKRLAVYARGARALNVALMLTLWSRQIMVCSDGDAELQGEHRERLANAGIELIEQRIADLTHVDGELSGVRFVDGSSIECDALFFSTGSYERSELAERLGCNFNDQSGIETDDHRETCVSGVYAAGDVLRDDVQFFVLAAAQGTAAAARLNLALLEEDLANQGTPLSE